MTKIETHRAAIQLKSVLIALVCFCNFLLAQEGKTVTTIEGIFYLDRAPIAIDIEEGTIINIRRKKELSDPALMNTYIAPGFIEHQVYGYMSYSFVGENLSVAPVREITHKFWEHGVTTYLPTLTTNDGGRMLKSFAVLVKATKDQEIALSVPGFHVEGPYISPIDGFRGAHIPKWIRKPDWQEFEKWYEATNHKILEITIAPELEGAMDFIGKCREKNIVVALGHHNGSAENIRQAVDLGASVSTHLGNGCANMIHRHENPLWVQLADDRLAASIIVDGFHLRPEEVNTFYKVKGADNTILVSDVISLAGMPAGTYRNETSEVVVTPEGKVMMPSENVLAGASFLLTRGIENVMDFTQCSLADAIKMTSKNPAKLLGLSDRGEIRPGKRADIVLFTMNGNKIEIQKL